MKAEENLDMYPEAIRKHLRDIGHIYYHQEVSLGKFYNELLLEINDYKNSLFSAAAEKDISRYINEKNNSFSELEKRNKLAVLKLSPVLEQQINLQQHIATSSPIIQNKDMLENDISIISKIDNESVLNNDQKDTRLKRNASKKAVANINKQVNQNVKSKLRRPNGNSSLDDNIDESLIKEVTQDKNEMGKRKTRSGSTVLEVDENKENISNANLNQNLIRNEKAVSEDGGTRRSARKRSTVVKQELTDDREIMPPPAVPLGRATRTKTRKARNTQRLTSIESESDNESGTSKEDGTQTSKQATSAISSHLENKLNEMNSSIKTSVVDSNTENLKIRGSKTRASSRKQNHSIEEVDISVSAQEVEKSVHEISSDTESVLQQIDTRPKRTRTKKNQPVQEHESQNSDVSLQNEVQKEKRSTRTKTRKNQKQQSINLDNTSDTSIQKEIPASKCEEKDETASKLISENRPNSDSKMKTDSQTLSHFIEEVTSVQDEVKKTIEINLDTKHYDSKALDTALLQNETRPKRTKARKRQATQDDEEFPIKEKDGPVDIPNETRTTRTKARKIQKQQQVDLETSTQEMSAPKTAENEEITSQLPDSELTSAISRPKRTRKVNRENKAPSEQDYKNEVSKQNVEPISVDDTTVEAFHDAKDNARDPSFVSSPVRNSISNKRPLDATVILSKYSKKIKMSCDKTEQHSSDETFHICKEQQKVLNETVVLSSNTADDNQKKHAHLNQTVVIKTAQAPSYDSSLLTDDNSEVDETPPKLYSHNIKIPTKHSKDIRLISPVKQRVQQFERLAADNKAAADNVTSAAAKNKSKNLAANTEILSAGKRTRSNIVTNVESFLPTSALKVTVTSTTALESRRRNERELEATKKKDAILQAKRLEQKLKRETKAAAAAAARVAAAREREQTAEAARLKQEKINQVTAQRSEQRTQINNKKRIEQERKVAESEEKKRLEEEARIARAREIELEQQKAAEEKRKQLEENERLRKEALAEEKKRQAARQEFIAKKNEEKRLLALQHPKSKSKITTPLKTCPGFAATPLKTKNTETVTNMPSSDSTDGFEDLVLEHNSDKPKREVPTWCRSEHRNYQLQLQRYIVPSLIDKLFMVKRENPRLEEIFPNIDKNMLKRTSSAMWKTPPRYSMMPFNKY